MAITHKNKNNKTAKTVVKIFKQNVILQLLIIIAVSVCLWMKAFVSPLPATTPDGAAVLYETLFAWLVPHPVLSAVLALLLVLAEGLWINSILYNHKLIPQNTLLPMLFFVTVMGFGRQQLTLTPMVVANIAIIGGMKQLMVPENLTISLDRIFNTALFTAIASLIYTPAMLVLVPMIIAFTIHNLYRWRHWVMLLLGFLAPYIIAATCYFMSDRLFYAYYLMRCDLSRFDIIVAPTTPWLTVTNILLLLLMTVALVSYTSRLGGRTTMFRKNSSVVTLLIISAILMAFYGVAFPLSSQLFAIPAAFLLTTFFVNLPVSSGISHKKWTWLYDIMLILTIVISF